MPRMRLILFGISAFSYWLCAPSAPDASCKVSAKILKNCEPVLEALRHLGRLFPFLPRPYHVSTTSHAKRPLSEAICHLVVRMPKGKDFCRVESGVFVSVPSSASCSLRSRFLFTSSFARAMCFAGASTSTLGRVASLGDASLLPRRGASRSLSAPTLELKA